MNRQYKGFKVSILHSHNEFMALGPEWKELHSSVPCTTPFQSWEWCLSWWEGFQSWYDRLDIVCAYDGPFLVILMAFAIKNEQNGHVAAFFLGDTYSDYVDILVRKGYEFAIENLFFSWIKSSTVSEINIRHLPEWSPLFPILSKNNYRPLMRFTPDPEWTDPKILRVSTPATWDEFLEKYQGYNHRYRIRKSFRDVQTRGLQLSYADSLSLDEIQKLIAFHLHSRVIRNLAESSFSAATPQIFLSSALNRMFSSGQARVFRLTEGNRLVYFFIVLKDQDWYFTYLSGMDVDYMEIRPGVAILAFMVRDSIEKELRGVDLGIGQEDYKNNWGNTDVNVLVGNLLVYDGVNGIIDFLRNKYRVRTRLRQFVHKVRNQNTNERT